MKIKAIENDKVFDLPQANGVWFAYYQTLCLYLLNFEELKKVYEDNKDDYNSIIDPAIVFLRDILAKLEQDGVIKDVSLPAEGTPDLPEKELKDSVLEQPNQQHG